MATINQIQKQLERAKVCLAEYEKNASIYDARATKAIERAKKATGREFDRANYTYVLCEISVWELKNSITSNLKSYYEMCYWIERAKANIEGLTKVLEQRTKQLADADMEKERIRERRDEAVLEARRIMASIISKAKSDYEKALEAADNEMRDALAELDANVRVAEKRK